MGPRDGGTPENTKFETKRLHPNELNPGQLVGQLPANEPAPKGEAQIPVRGPTQKTLQEMAEKVDSEVLPAEYREQIYRYMELMRGPAEDSGKSGEDAGARPEKADR